METLLVVNVLPHLYAVSVVLTCVMQPHQAVGLLSECVSSICLFFLPPFFQRYILINLSLSLRTHGFATIKTIICQLVIEKLNISYSRSIS